MDGRKESRNTYSSNDNPLVVWDSDSVVSPTVDTVPGVTVDTVPGVTVDTVPGVTVDSEDNVKSRVCVLNLDWECFEILHIEETCGHIDLVLAAGTFN